MNEPFTNPHQATINRLIETTPELAKILQDNRISTPEAIATMEIEIERYMCQKHFYHFVRRAWVHVHGQTAFEDSWHVAAMCYHYQALVEKQFDTLVVNISPNCSKSTLACTLLPVWVWINNPAAGLWFSSFSKLLCNRDADRMRLFLQSDWFKRMFGDRVKLRDDQGQLQFYHNEAGGWRLAATIGSKSGFGMHPTLLGIDDPHNPKEAGSEAYTRFACDYWTDTIASRGILSGVVKFLCAQRLSENDLSAHILRLNPDTVHLCIPMQFDPGRRCVTKIRYADIDDLDERGNPTIKTEWHDPRDTEGQLMWPQFFTEEKLKAAQRPMRAHQIAGQYQQTPTSPEGDLFKREWFGSIVDAPPQDGRAVRAWDKASTVGHKADYTAGVLMVFDGQFYYVVDVIRGKWERKDRDARIRAAAESDVDLFGSYEIRFEREGASAGKDAASMQAEELAGDFRVFIDKAMGKPKSLEDDAKGWDVWCDLLSRGVVKLVKGAWNEEFIAEHMAAPFAHDDMIDAASHAARTLVGTGRRKKINRPLLLLTDEDQHALAKDTGEDMCRYCFGPGCPSCNFTGKTPNLGDIASIIPPVPEDDVWLM